MGYKLSEDLGYKSKLFGNLTFKQSGYLGGGIMAIMLIALNTQSIVLQMTSAVIIGSFSIGLTWFDLDKKIKDRAIYQMSIDEAGYLDDEAFNFLEMDDIIRENAVKRQDGRYLAIIEVDPVNLQIKSRDEVNRLVAQYESFLDGLDFPVHINIRTISALRQIQDYLSKHEEFVEARLQETGNTQFRDKFEEYREFWTEYVKEHGVKTRKYYIILESDTGNEDKAMRQLDRRTQLVRETLPSELNARRLSTIEITRFLASYFGDFVQIDEGYFSKLTLPKDKYDDYSEEKTVEDYVTADGGD